MRIRRYVGAVRVEVARHLGVSVGWSRRAVVLPRVHLLLNALGEEAEAGGPEETLTVAFELSNGWLGSDPVLDVCLEVPWRASWPWQLDVTLPPKQGDGVGVLVWRSPLCTPD